jgi:hypothetical protein
MKTVGVNIGGSGENAVRLRPMLVFQKHHGAWLVLSSFLNLKLELTSWFCNSYDTAGEDRAGPKGVISPRDINVGCIEY